MEMQRWVCVIDLFGVNYDGPMPSILLACGQGSLDLFPVAPVNPLTSASADDPDRRLYLVL